MKYTRLTFLLMMLFFRLLALGQDIQIDSLKNVLSQNSQDSNGVKTLIELAKKLRGAEPDKALEYSKQALALAEKIEYVKGRALGNKWIGLYYFDKAQFVNASDYWKKSLEYYQQLKDDDGISNMLNNLGSIYYNNGNNAKALEYYLPALEAGQRTGNKLRIATTTQNIGLIYMSKPATWNEALVYLKNSLVISEQINDLDNISSCNANIGEVYLNMKNDSIALYHFARAKKAAEPNSPNLPYILNKIGDVMKQRKDLDAAKKWYEDSYAKAEEQDQKLFMVTAANSIAEIYRLKKQPIEALIFLKKANIMAADIPAANELKNSYKGLANTYGDISDFRNAYTYQLKYSNLADSLFLLSSDSIQNKFEVGLKEKEIDLLTKDKKIVEEEIRRQKLVRNALIAGFLLVSTLIFILYRDYRNKIKTNKLLDQRKAEIESLLLNILPYEVAVELQNTGHATPRFYENASVLFTDFVSFSKIAESLSPQQVVEELNEFFIAMDDIIEKYQLEKIKTIGDSYMCAGGVPTENRTHPVAIVKAGLEILEYLNVKNSHREKSGLPKWELRIGIHTGPLVAGVVGKKKYAYDIWGSTVNIASRMESNGQPGLLNISSALYEQIKDKFDCSYRGKIYAKNVGEIDMYFVNREITDNKAVISEQIILQS
jgi:adenylate cyclase